jgi:hypothetical protein
LVWFAIENVVFSFFTVLTATLLVISVLAFRRSKNRKMLLLAGVFGLFFVKGLVISLSLFFDLLGAYSILIVFGIVDCGAVLLLYLSTLGSGKGR